MNIRLDLKKCDEEILNYKLNTYISRFIENKNDLQMRALYRGYIEGFLSALHVQGIIKATELTRIEELVEGL